MSISGQGKATARRQEPSRLGDKLLVGIGIMLAAASAFFPWYVFLNEDKFGLRIDPFENTRDLPPSPPRQVFSVSPMAMIDRTKDQSLPIDPFDQLTTATVSSLGREEQGPLPEQQPMPGTGKFRLMHVANGRALIEDGSGMYMVRIGSVLPDNSKVATLEQRNGRWVIITSTGEVYQDQNTSSAAANP
jgi:hypothetical protein